MEIMGRENEREREREREKGAEERELQSLIFF